VISSVGTHGNDIMGSVLCEENKGSTGCEKEAHEVRE